MTESPSPTDAAGFERNVRLYPAYALAFNAFAWMPVFMLYFTQTLSLAEALRLEAIYYAAVVATEVPSGYFSDRVGRRATLLVAAIALLAAYVLFAVGGFAGVVEPSFALFAAAQVLLAVGLSFNSGTDASFHYDSLASLGRTEEFADREAIAARNGLLASGGAALAGGAVAVIGLHWAYVLSAIAAAAMLAIVLRFVEPTAKEKSAGGGLGFVRQLGKCLSLLRGKTLAWLFAFFVLMTILNHVPYEFYPLYIREAVGGGETNADFAPLYAGLHMAAAMVLGAVAAAWSVKLRDKLGIGAALLLAAAIQTAVIAAMGFVLAVWVIPLILLRVVPRALMTAPLNAAIAPRVEQQQRATYLSIQSLAGRLAFSATLAGLSLISPDGEEGYAAMAAMLRASLVIACVGLVVLGATVWVLRERAVDRDATS